MLKQGQKITISPEEVISQIDIPDGVNERLFKEQLVCIVLEPKDKKEDTIVAYRVDDDWETSTYREAIGYFIAYLQSIAYTIEEKIQQL